MQAKAFTVLWYTIVAMTDKNDATSGNSQPVENHLFAD
jgi:hypothetical protein